VTVTAQSSDVVGTAPGTAHEQLSESPSGS
jgi:hypothetical protein